MVISARLVGLRISETADLLEIHSVEFTQKETPSEMQLCRWMGNHSGHRVTETELLKIGEHQSCIQIQYTETNIRGKQVFFERFCTFEVFCAHKKMFCYVSIL